MNSLDLAKSRRETMRWYLLRALNYARPQAYKDTSLLAIMQGIYPDATELEMRRELSYLESRDLIELQREPLGGMWATLTRHGVDIAEYTVECDAGIARPPVKAD